ncbi:hypothetical protein [Allohahella marinimesophila]|uniref:hypothetical protein n=1 Tax=Allohahella marinimesophila TaxID=1054972 RepID=UPI0031DF399C
MDVMFRMVNQYGERANRLDAAPLAFGRIQCLAGFTKRFASVAAFLCLHYSSLHVQLIRAGEETSDIPDDLAQNKRRHAEDRRASPSVFECAYPVHLPCLQAIRGQYSIVAPWVRQIVGRLTA